jgi:hypothetical protein
VTDGADAGELRRADDGTNVAASRRRPGARVGDSFRKGKFAKAKKRRIPMTEQSTTPGQGASSPAHADQAVIALKSNAMAGARELKDELTHLAGGVAGEAKKTAESNLSAGKDRAAAALSSVANAVRRTGEHLRDDDQVPVANYFDKAAHQVDVASDYLQSRSFDQVIGDVERFARREPALFLGGAFVAGLIGGRFLKSSHPQAASKAHERDHATAPRTRGASESAPSARPAQGNGPQPGLRPPTSMPKGTPSTVPPPRGPATPEGNAPKPPGAK